MTHDPIGTLRQRADGRVEILDGGGPTAGLFTYTFWRLALPGEVPAEPRKCRICGYIAKGSADEHLHLVKHYERGEVVKEASRDF